MYFINHGAKLDNDNPVLGNQQMDSLGSGGHRFDIKKGVNVN